MGFDYMDPSVSIWLLRELGWPEEFIGVAESIWCHQERWIAYGKHTHKEVLEVDSATPQGESMAPIMFNLWMAAGAHFTDELLRESDRKMIMGGAVPPRRDKCIYMDDRSFTSECPHDIMHQVAGWEHWSELVGFKENRGKLQLTAWSEEKREEMKAAAGGFQDKVMDSIVILGIGTVGNYGRTSDDKEQERLTDGIRRTRRIKFLPCEYRTKQNYISAFGMSKASYGWITRTPTVKESNKFDTARPLTRA